MGLVNTISSRYLRHSNPRVSAPPGAWVANGKRNIIVATSMRSGTHLMIDLILNSFPEYRRKPLYLNLDKLPLGTPEVPDLHNCGYVIKTHYPANAKRQQPERVAELARDSLVIVVKRPVEDIRKSLSRWIAEEPDHVLLRRQLENLDAEINQFDAFWSALSPYVVEYRDLFDADRNRQVVAEIGRRLGHDSPGDPQPVLPLSNRYRVYLNKALTRLVGYRAPRIDTTIRAMR
jgi:hypothetical protein